MLCYVMLYYTILRHIFIGKITMKFHENQENASTEHRCPHGFSPTMEFVWEDLVRCGVRCGSIVVALFVRVRYYLFAVRVDLFLS